MVDPVPNKLDSGTLEQLQELIQLNLDSRDGFREAAQQVEDPLMKREFLSAADLHSTQAAELQHYVVVNEEDPITTGSWIAALRRTWGNVRDTFTAQDLFATLDRVEQGAGQVQAAYEQAMQQPGDDVAVQTALQTQHTATKALHDRIKGLRDAVAAR